MENEPVADLPHPHKRILIGWFSGAAGTIFLPLLIFTIARATNSEQEENNGENNDNNENNATPWWFFANSNRRDEERTPPILIATYLWSVLVFSGLVYYGYLHLKKSMDYNEIVVALVIFANYSILSMFLFSGVEGAIETEGPAVEEHGFVGQFGVMVRPILISRVLQKRKNS
jgi:predicted permease